MEPNTLDVHKLLRVMPFRSREANRPILQGVYLDPSGVIVATTGGVMGCEGNGHTLAAGPILDVDDKVVQAWLKEVARRFRSADSAPVSITAEGEAVTLEDPACGRVTVRTIEGPYPYWRNIVPAAENMAPDTLDRRATLALNHKYLGLFPVDRPNFAPVLHFTSGKGGVMAVTVPKHRDFVGFIMPCRVDTAPTWAGLDAWLAEHNAEAGAVLSAVPND